MYKVLAKILANRLCSVIGSVVSDSQSAFVKGRQILDDILVANEAVDEARRFKKELLLFKVDFEKAYNSVDLNYLDVVMHKMNFPILWRKWISECVRTTTTSVLVNGCPTEEFPIERGLRQGDPLSPFLFLLAAEGFNVLMKALIDAGLFSGYSVGRDNAISLSHLQFADDTLIVGEKSWLNVHSMRAILLIFEQVSGLKVNFHKSMLTGVNVTASWLHEAAIVLNCRVGVLPFVYLGLPIGGDPRRLDFWKPILNNIISRLSNWKSKSLSFGGRLVLLKSVLSSLSGYFHSFEDNVRTVVGGGSSTYFWLDHLVVGAPLRVLFPRLFDLAVNKGVTVQDMDRRGWENGGGAWEWRRRLLAWEEETVTKCSLLLHDIVLQDNIADRWRWILDPINNYSVKATYHYLTRHDVMAEHIIYAAAWLKQVPLKVLVFVWRLLCNRLPTKDNLLRQRVLQHDDTLCVGGCGLMESANHLVLYCEFFGNLWYRLFQG